MGVEAFSADGDRRVTGSKGCDDIYSYDGGGVVCSSLRNEKSPYAGGSIT